MALIDDQLSVLQSLLPRGLAWNRAPTSNLTKLLSGIAGEFARVASRAQDLLTEANPLETSELVSDWEEALGLPDDCTTGTLTLDERRAQIVHKLTNIGGQNAAYFVRIAGVFGFTVSVDNFRRFRAGRARAGDRCYGADWVWYFRVNSPGEFSETLECIIRRAAPSHTSVIFQYG